MNKPAIAALQGLLILPALLFMCALALRNLPQHELALNAQSVVMWYAARQWTLWMLLILLPMAVLVTGCVTLFSARNNQVERPWTLSAILSGAVPRFVTTATLMAGGILAIVVLHMAAN